MKKYLINNNIDDQINLHNIVAKMKKAGNQIIKSFGLNELVEKTKNILNKIQIQSYYLQLKIKLKKKMENIIDEDIKIGNDIKFNDLQKKLYLFIWEMII